MKAKQWVLGACLSAVGASCASEKGPATQVIVAVHSDLVVGEALTSITAQVQTADGKTTVAAPFAFSLAAAPAAGRHTLPLSFGITRPADGADSFRVVVNGYGPASPGGAETLLVEYEALVSFQNERTLRLTAFLGGACARKACSAAGADSVCYPAAEGAVPAGACGPVTTPALSAVQPKEELNGVVWPDGTVTNLDPDDAVDAPRKHRYTGVGYNQTARRGFVIEADLTLRSEQVDGFMNTSAFPGDPSPLCSAGLLMATRQGSAVSGYFISADGDIGCGFDKGRRFDLTGQLTADESNLVGTFTVNGQVGVLEAWQRPTDATSCQGDLLPNGGTSYPLHLSVLLGQRTISGRWEGQDSSAGPACSQGRFAGMRKIGGAVEFEFLQSDPRPACNRSNGVRQVQLAEVSADGTQINGTFTPATGTGGTFRVTCDRAL